MKLEFDDDFTQILGVGSRTLSPEPLGELVNADNTYRFSSMVPQAMRVRVAAALGTVRSVREAAQTLAAQLHADFASEFVLARVYITVPYHRLPARDQQFLTSRHASIEKPISDDTLVLSLLGTAGVAHEWNDRERSEGHLAIPLFDETFVRGMPMLARLLGELGVDLGGLSLDAAIAARRLIGGFNGVFYVADARTAVDEQGRRIIPAQDFVTTYEIRTVLGTGGAYLGGTIVAIIAFSRSHIERSVAERIATLVTPFKMATRQLVDSGSFY